MFLKILKTLDHHLGLRNRLHGLPASGFDLGGEKILDWGWCLGNLPHSPRQRILDVGCAQAPILPAALAMGHEVYGIDTEELPYNLPDLTFYQADFLDHDFGSSRFDVIILCSIVEHIGLAKRYGQRDVPDGDLQAMRKVAGLLKPGGILMLTVPVGKDMLFSPWHRIYGPERIPRLLDGLELEKERFFIKEPSSFWHAAERNTALKVDRKGLSYALGQFLLKTRGR
ncbi:MAG: DUF268 domain-containing protein [Candidatus Brocadiia bacterium]|nr:MAG: DUF268 domain-containing protein [Candidatus Brocadiia bacterium]